MLYYESQVKNFDKLGRPEKFDEDVISFFVYHLS